jgi:RNA polymerase sigma-70 factor (ECF subfamily)
MYFQNEIDETLVMLTLAGEQRAYEVLVTRYQKAVMASAVSVTQNHFMAEDAAQDAFVTAWMKLNTLQEPGKYGSWVCRIAKNCALNMINRYRSYLPLDVVDNLHFSDDSTQSLAEMYALSEERNEVNKSIEMLPEKVKQIIRLHYFENLSIAEIADRMRISEGTVKWQLHDGRKRIRKELCAMNEKYSDTLVQRVMKKVEELKLWQVINDKSGFEKVYKDVLREVEDLPECTEKHHALADVLMRGWWWIPGKKNDALFARIVDAAMEGKNEEVMTFIVSREDSKVYGGARVEFIRDKQIPRLEKAGFVKALGREWFWLGYNLFREGKPEEGHAAYSKVEEILTREDAYRILVPYARRMEEEITARYRDAVTQHYEIGGTAEEYRMIDGKLRYWNHEGVKNGALGSIDYRVSRIFQNASGCDGYFFADIYVGESFVGSDGTKLSYISNNETVDTPAGRFEGCQLWEVRRWSDQGKIVCRTYYQDGVGIVRQEHTTDGATDTRTLSAYEIRGGKGLLPLAANNTWEYVAEYASDVMVTELKITVAFADDERMILARWDHTERLKYDETSWLDAVQEIANEYCQSKNGGDSYICDVSSAIERAEKLAVTPMQKAHTKAAASVARRIMATDTTFNPNHTATGHWNFFNRTYVRKKPDSFCLTSYHWRWSFEWKSWCGEIMEPLLCNDILGILDDATHCLWSDEWRIGASPVVEYVGWDNTIRTQIHCEDGGTITTKAGTFENCFKLCLDINGMGEGVDYRGGKKVYYFADGIGIVRTENEYSGGARTAVYELTAYEGVGEGFMPVADGLMRRYDAQNLTDGFVGAAEYTYVADEDGDIVIFADRTGIRELPPPITEYSSIQGEIQEQELCDQGKWTEGQIKYGTNFYHLMLHMLARPSRNIFDAPRSIEIHGFFLKTMESFGSDGEVPPAWYPIYAWSAIIRAAALFGDGRKEEGYASLNLAIDTCEKLLRFKPGDLLEIGNKHLFGGAQYVHEKNMIQLADGSKEPISYVHRMGFDIKDLYFCITAPRGWEWFNSVRDEERFKNLVERVKKIANKD